MDSDAKNQTVSLDFGSDVIKMTQNFGNWYPGKDDPIHAVITDEIEDTLVADFDGTLGLGVDLRGAYNMSETLNALPVFNEPLEAPDSFTNILMASTSPATKLNEESLTYLNQGKPYELRLSRQGHYQNTYALMKSTVRVLFHERRLQVAEREQLNTWRMTRPGERILDVDEPLSYGICRVSTSEENLNSVDCYYLPCNTVGLYIKVHCISTEFTARKHGGERGIPFRIQVETFGMPLSPLSSPTSLAPVDFNIDTSMLLSCVDLMHCSVCQIKVFTTKGADRKNKTDKEKIAKRSDIERMKYHPSRVQTVLTQIELSAAKSIIPTGDFLLSTPRPSPVHHSIIGGGNVSPAIIDVRNQASAVAAGVRSQGIDTCTLSDDSSKSYDASRFSKCPSLSSPASLSNEIISTVKSSLEDNLISTEKVITNKSTPPSVREWLIYHRFNKYMNVLHDFTGYDLLCLSRDDLIQICGIADGIRLNNALQSKITRPKLTLYLCQNDLPLLRRDTYRERPTSITSISSLLSNSSLVGVVDQTAPITPAPSTAAPILTDPCGHLAPAMKPYEPTPQSSISIKSEPPLTPGLYSHGQYDTGAATITGQARLGAIAPAASLLPSSSSHHHRGGTPYSTQHRGGTGATTAKLLAQGIALGLGGGTNSSPSSLNVSSSSCKAAKSRLPGQSSLGAASVKSLSKSTPKSNRSNSIASALSRPSPAPLQSLSLGAIGGVVVSTESISCQTNLKFDDPTKNYILTNQNYLQTNVSPVHYKPRPYKTVSPGSECLSSLLDSAPNAVTHQRHNAYVELPADFLLEDASNHSSLFDHHSSAPPSVAPPPSSSSAAITGFMASCDIDPFLSAVATPPEPHRHRHSSDQMLSLTNQVSCASLDSKNSPPSAENSILRSLISSQLNAGSLPSAAGGGAPPPLAPPSSECSLSLQMSYHSLGHQPHQPPQPHQTPLVPMLERRASNQLNTVKRQLHDDYDYDDGADGAGGARDPLHAGDPQRIRSRPGIKKQKTFIEEILYKAVYLEQLTVDDFKEKIAPLCMILANQIADCTVQTSSGVNVIMTDDVIHNLPNETRYHVDTKLDEDTKEYRIILSLVNTNTNK